MIVLISGSRALDNDVHKPIVHREITNVIDALPLNSIVVFGDASGPDTWAWECVLRHNLRVGRDDVHYARFDLQGRITGTSRVWSERWEVGNEIARTQGRQVPLMRNVRMVAAVIRAAKLASQGVSFVDHCALYAWVANWSTTHGTEHTVRQWQSMGGPAPHVRRVER